MATPPISLATMGSAKKQASKLSGKKDDDGVNSSQQQECSSTTNKVQTTKRSNNDTKLRKFWGEEVKEDSIYSIYLKKITYSCNNNSSLINNSQKSNNRVTKGYNDLTERYNRIDEVDSEKNKSKDQDDVQCLQWETRQTRILKAATLDHIIRYILLLEFQHDNQNNNACTSSMLEDERNQVAHVMHVLFCTYRLYSSAHQLLQTILRYSDDCCSDQLNFVLHYWLDHYPEDFLTVTSELNGANHHQNHHKTTTNSSSAHSSFEKDSLSISNSDSETSQSDFKFSSAESSMTSENEVKQTSLIELFLSQPNIDESLYRKGLSVMEMKNDSVPDVLSSNHKSISKSSVLELESRFIAQQLTAIDLENFLSLKPYSLLTGSRSTPKIQSMIRNFNLLSRHVIITILKAHSPYVVASHWIEVALQLRKIRNFNSLKAIIAGLTNESVYRLKQVVWSKLSKASLSTFKWLSAIVDDVNNQTLLRHTQLVIEGTSKVSLEDESFGTIPYLGTFLTDITMIDSRYPNYIKSSSGIRLINFEKCSHQYEILMQIELLQKNVIAALTSIHQQSQQIGRVYVQTVKPVTSPTIPRVARIFRIWFQANDIASITDKQCYELSLALESSPNKNKTKEKH